MVLASGAQELISGLGLGEGGSEEDKQEQGYMTEGGRAERCEQNAGMSWSPYFSLALPTGRPLCLTFPYLKNRVNSKQTS